MDQEGAAPTLAVFLLLVLLCSAAAFTSFQTGHQRQVSTIQQLIAVDVVRASTSTIEGELNQTLSITIGAAMYEAGGHAENKENVEQRVRAYLNERIALGWSYSNMTVWVENCNENNLKLYWLPDGSIAARGYLAAEIRHVGGAAANGVCLSVDVTWRYERLHTVARLASEMSKTADDFETLEQELNDNYAGERLVFALENHDGRCWVSVRDMFGAKIIVKK